MSSEEEYKVATCTRHAVWEHQRAEGLQQLLQGPLTLPEHLLNLGELLFQVNLAPLVLQKECYRCEQYRYFQHGSSLHNV